MNWLDCARIHRKIVELARINIGRTDYCIRIKKELVIFKNPYQEEASQSLPPLL